MVVEQQRKKEPSIHATRPRLRYSPMWYLTTRPPSGIPPVFWKLMRWQGGALVVLVSASAIVLSLAVIIILQDGFGLGSWLQSEQMVVLMCVTLLLSTIYYLVVSRMCARRFAHRVRSHHFQICWYCGYCLYGIPEDHGCPECGANFSVTSLQERWQAWFSDAGRTLRRR